MSEKELLAEVVRRTRSALPDLKRLILFGSRARNQARMDSDFDLVAIVERAPASGPRTVAWRLALIGLDAAFDLVVLTVEEWERAAALPGSAAAAAKHEGRVLDVAAQSTRRRGVARPGDGGSLRGEQRA